MCATWSSKPNRLRRPTSLSAHHRRIRTRTFRSRRSRHNRARICASCSLGDAAIRPRHSRLQSARSHEALRNLSSKTEAYRRPSHRTIFPQLHLSSRPLLTDPAGRPSDGPRTPLRANSAFRSLARAYVRLHLIPPLSLATPPTWRPRCGSSAGVHGTRAEPRPLSIMAKRPELSVRRWRTVPPTRSPAPGGRRASRSRWTIVAPTASSSQRRSVARRSRCGRCSAPGDGRVRPPRNAQPVLPWRCASSLLTGTASPGGRSRSRAPACCARCWTAWTAVAP
jgi:hypothetical protein